MSITTIHPICDGPISLDTIRNERASKVAAMAHALLDNHCYADHGDSIMILVGCGFSTFEVMALIDDARQVATQHAVEIEMAFA